jgi:hypothetical protein
MQLGERRRPVGGRMVERQVLPTRPDVIAEDGTVYEVIWYPHRDAVTLLPGLIDRGVSYLQERGRFVKSQSAPWKWTG